MTITFHSGCDTNFKWPYQATVMKMLEQMSKMIVHLSDFGAPVMDGVAKSVWTCTSFRAGTE